MNHLYFGPDSSQQLAAMESNEYISSEAETILCNQENYLLDRNVS